MFFRLLISFLILLSVPAYSEEFAVSDVRVEGLQRVSAGSVFRAFPINAGDNVDTDGVRKAIRSLFGTGLFTDIEVGRDGGILVVTVKERPSISKIEIEGNKSIQTEDLMAGLEGAGLTEGQVFKRVTLEKLELEILRSYVAQGRYNASIDAKVEDQERNRVAIKIDIDEGDIASILHINIVGNEVFSDEELKDLMELKTPGLFSFITSDDKYAKEKLSGDLERIRSYYLDRGYLKFSIESTQVSISPDKKAVFITLNVSEGPLYTVKEVILKGNLIVEEDELRKLILLNEGENFSRLKLTTTSDIISKRLGREGYTFANVTGIPEAHDDYTTTITFLVDPGRRAYVRKINFSGNVSTSDEVLRQEMVQMEGGVASTDLIDASKSRLERLGFFKTVTVETPAVPGTNDQIDVNYSVEEQPSGSLSASLGYSQGGGLVLGGNVSENNFFGTGKRVSFGLNASQSVRSANFSYMNPYYTVDGVSRGFSINARETDYAKQDISDYTLDSISASVSFGYPINNFSRLNFGLSANNSKVSTGNYPAVEILDFVEGNPTGCERGTAGCSGAYGDDFDLYSVTAGWTRNTLNRGVFATEGMSQSFSVEMMIPGLSDLEFYKVSYRNKYYFPLTKDHGWVVHMKGELGFGDGFSDNHVLPFFEHYYSGGYGSVRGWRSNTLGPRSHLTVPATNSDGGVVDFDTIDGIAATDAIETTSNGTELWRSSELGDPFGGNVLIEGGMELIFPTPFVKDSSSMRTSFFFDIGNVFDTARGFDPDLGELRYSVGVGLNWLTAIGPLSFSLAKPLNDKADDDTQVFQFSLGQPF